MNLKELIAADAGVFFDLDGIAVPVLYDGIEIIAIPVIGEGKTRDQINRKETAFFRVNKADVPRPKLGNVLIYNDKEWSFAEIAESNTISHLIKFYSGESATWLR